jgi:hypothetical protein
MDRHAGMESKSKKIRRSKDFLFLCKNRGFIVYQEWHLVVSQEAPSLSRFDCSAAFLDIFGFGPGPGFTCARQGHSLCQQGYEAEFKLQRVIELEAGWMDPSLPQLTMHVTVGYLGGPDFNES